MKIVGSSLNILNMKSRLPFRYGIATLAALPHLFVRLEVNIDGKVYIGTAADGLAPKWFTKNPNTSFEEDIHEMLLVIENAVETSKEYEAETVFGLWLKIYEKQEEWGRQKGLETLLTSFGVSLVERALIEVACKASGKPFYRALREGDLGFDILEIYPELNPQILHEAIPDKPSDEIYIRHTVGLADPITSEEIPTSERVNDSLPQSLEDCVKTYCLKFLKIKLSGHLGNDRERLLTIDRVMQGVDYKITLDGNEYFKNVETFKLYWESLSSDASLQKFLSRLIVLEQPFHRSIALSDSTGKQLLSWEEKPKIIIDESDGELTSAGEALLKGYAGVSFKNCKGVFKGVANACLMYAKDGVLTGEDLCNVGPVALIQDLAVASTLGLTNVERNGHHYMKGLSMFPENVQNQVLEFHDELYKNKHAFPALEISNGQIDLKSINEGPLGMSFEINSQQFQKVEDWSFGSLKN